MPNADVGTIFRAYVLAEHARTNSGARSRNYIGRRKAAGYARQLRRILEDCSVLIDIPEGAEKILKTVSLSSLGVDPSSASVFGGSKSGRIEANY